MVVLTCWFEAPSAGVAVAVTTVPGSGERPKSETTTVTETLGAGLRTWTLPWVLKAAGSVVIASIASLCWGETLDALRNF